MTRKYCPSCAYWNPEGDIFCENCGTKLPESESASLQPQAGRYCSNCGEAVLQGNTFCPNCGYQIRHVPREATMQIPKQTVSRVTVEKGRSTSITVATVLFITYGILGIIGAFLIIGGSIMFGMSASFLAYFVPIPYAQLSGVLPGLVGIVWLLISVFGIVAGVELWRSRKIGGKIGIALSSISIVFIVMIAFLPMYLGQGSINYSSLLASPYITPMILIITLNLISLAFTLIGWRSLF